MISTRPTRGCSSARHRRLTRALGLLGGLELGRAAMLTDGREARRWPVGTLVIYYRRKGDVLEVLRVFDARREPIER